MVDVSSGIEVCDTGADFFAFSFRGSTRRLGLRFGFHSILFRRELIQTHSDEAVGKEALFSSGGLRPGGPVR